MPRWKGQKSIQNDTEQNEQTNRLFILGCKLQGRVKWPRPMQQKSDVPNLRTPTLIPPIHLPLRAQPPVWASAPGLSPKIVGAKRSVTETIFQGHMTHNWHFLQWRSTTSTGYNMIQHDTTMEMAGSLLSGQSAPAQSEVHLERSESNKWIWGCGGDVCDTLAT